MQALTTNDLDNALACIFENNQRFTYRGCTPKLPPRLRPASVHVINSDATGSGMHWLYVDVDRSGHVAFFDTFAQAPASYRKRLATLIRASDNRFWSSDRVVQSLTSVACGHHVVRFSRARAGGVPCQEILDTYYSGDFEANDTAALDSYARSCGTTGNCRQAQPY